MAGFYLFGTVLVVTGLIYVLSMALPLLFIAAVLYLAFLLVKVFIKLLLKKKA